ncbi:atypical PilZ domain-containing cyclic di-GMP receptor [Sulfuritortus calidifontis]|uniref:Atypical PilZ domain-containing cyclic di-GMP receptor n=1 Tax=Sulfuritortus calidifontis TaxID=1914471 RepID=A0A4R3JTB5_9PROT|nr:PilZ domain-containing protein [Sulfuritortus calidifontis]TCS70553.1 atypical PilZ domain-containing cyclic di-GMP receptor [Sulfuritortus calidifontis]
MNSTLRVEAFLPIAWEKQAMEPQTLAALRKGAQLLMHAFNLMDLSPLHESDGDNAHLQRLDAKVDLILHLLAQNLQGSRSLPTSVNVELGPEIVSWQEAGTLPAVGDTVVVALYLNPGLPLPVRLPAHVTASGDGRVTVRLAELGHELEEFWQQWVFRQHRREVHARRPGY